MKDKYEKVIALPASATYLTIDTRDGYKNLTSSTPADGSTGVTGINYATGFLNPNQNQFDINIYKNEAMFNGRINRIALQELNMLYTCPNVNPYNNVLFFQALDDPSPELWTVPTPIVIPSSWYNGFQLAIAIQDALNNYQPAGAPLPTGLFSWTTWLVQFRPDNSSFKIYSGSNTRLFRINPMYGLDKGFGDDAYGTGQTTKIKRTDTLATMMGFGNTSTQPCSVVSSSSASLLYTTYIDVISNTITSNQLLIDNTTSNNTGRNLLSRIYLSKDMMSLNESMDIFTPSYPTGLTGATGAYDSSNEIIDSSPIGNVMWINYEPPSITKQIRWDPDVQLYGINIQLRDDKGELLYDYKPFNYTDPENPISGGTGGTGISWNKTISGSSSYAQMSFLISEDE